MRKIDLARYGKGGKKTRTWVVDMELKDRNKVTDINRRKEEGKNKRHNRPEIEKGRCKWGIRRAG